MNETENIDRVIVALRKVPGKHLLIIDLVHNSCLPDGELDYNELERIQPEVNLAIAEAKMYGAHTLAAVDTLKRLEARTEDVGP